MSQEGEVRETVDPKVLQAVYLHRIDSNLRQLLQEIRDQRDAGLYASFQLAATTAEKMVDFEADYPYTRVSGIEIINDAASDLTIRINEREKGIVISTGKTTNISYNRKVIKNLVYRLASGIGTIKVTLTW